MAITLGIICLFFAAAGIAAALEADNYLPCSKASKFFDVSAWVMWFIAGVCAIVWTVEFS